MTLKSDISLAIILSIIFFASVLVHEWVHVFQIHFLLGIPYQNISMHFIWEITDFSKFTLLNLPLAWVSFPNDAGTNTAEFEIGAYTIQIAFLFVAYYFALFKKSNKQQSVGR